MSVQYLTGVSRTEFKKKKVKVDYKEVLDEATFQKYDLLRQCRKEVAEMNGVPVYAIFTNDELSKIAGLTDITEENIINLSGIGSGKMKKFGKALIESYYLKNKDEARR